MRAVEGGGSDTNEGPLGGISFSMSKERKDRLVNSKPTSGHSVFAPHLLSLVFACACLELQLHQHSNASTSH